VPVIVLVMHVDFFSCRVQEPRIQRRVALRFFGVPISHISFSYVRCPELGHLGPESSEHEAPIRSESFMQAGFRVRLPAAFHDAAGAGKLASAAISPSRPESSLRSKLVVASVL
jgi:hypothetical protein